jgi:hypothetical protein
MTILSVMILFVFNESTFAVAEQSLLNDNIGRNISLQSSLNSTSIMLESDDKHIVITWLEENGTEANNTPVINITSQELWKAFTPLLEISTNRTTTTGEYLGIK